MSCRTILDYTELLNHIARHPQHDDEQYRDSVGEGWAYIEGVKVLDIEDLLASMNDETWDLEVLGEEERR